MKNRVLGNQTMCKVGSQRRTIWRAGRQRRACGYNSTSGLISMIGALVMKNRVVGSLCRAIWSLCRAILRIGSQCREPVQGLGVSILHPVWLLCLEPL